MNTPVLQEKTLTIEAFREQYLRDREQENVKSLSSYLSQFPGDDSALVMEYLAFESPSVVEGAGLESLAPSRDALTGMLTRAALERDLTKAHLSLSDPDTQVFGVLLLDLDGFKQVNDRQGHLAGDSVLRVIARTISGAAPPLARTYRYGGDEFVMIVPGADATRLTVLGNRLRRAVAGTSISTIHGKASVGLSVGGIAVSNHAVSANAATILARADRQLYRAKRNGKNRVYVAEWRN